MSRPSTFCLSESSKRKVSWWVMLALLFIQIKVAIGGCMLMDELQPAKQSMQMQTGGVSCAEHDTQQLCMKHCAHSSDALKLTLDLPVFSPALLPSAAPVFVEADSARIETSDLPAAIAGPPSYLRFLRLLN